MVRTFPYEVLGTDAITVVDARPTVHPVVVIHEAIGRDKRRAKWVVTHGPTSCAITRYDTLKECNRLARELARRDPTGELLTFYDPEPAAFKAHFPGKWIPIEAYEVFAAARAAVGLRTTPHPLEG